MLTLRHAHSPDSLQVTLVLPRTPNREKPQVFREYKQKYLLSFNLTYTIQTIAKLQKQTLCNSPTLYLKSSMEFT